MRSSLVSRLYRDESDLLQMQALLMEARRQTDDWRYAHVGELNFNYFMLVCHLDPRQFIRLWFDGAALVGYATLGEDPAWDFQVLPGYEWQGIEAQALAWVEARLAELRPHHPEAFGGPLVTGARQDNLQRRAFLEAYGFRQGGPFSEVNMLCRLDEPLPPPTAPAGFQVRELAAEGETGERAAAHREVWQPWTVGNVSDDDYAACMRMPGYDRSLDIVAVAPDGTIAAYVNGWLDPRNRIGDFGPVGARPAYRRQGLTQAVLRECQRRMQALGMARIAVSTGVDNTPAIRLYESVGFRIVNRYLEYGRDR